MRATSHGSLGSRRFAAVMAAGALGLSSCAITSATPPSVVVAGVQLTGTGLLEQSVLLTLCATNPNRAALDFSRVSFVLNVSGAELARGTSDAPVRLPPLASTLVPLLIAVSDRNLGVQILSTLETGSIAYRLDGTVTLLDVPIAIPFSRAGRLSLLDAGLQLAATDELPPPTPCRSSSGGLPA